MKTCVSCEHSQKPFRFRLDCNRRPCKIDKIHGAMSSARSCGFERTRLWRWLGIDTCGPEGRYWTPRKPLTPPTAARPSR